MTSYQKQIACFFGMLGVALHLSVASADERARNLPPQSLTFVLDCSDLMGGTFRKTASGAEIRRFDAAKEVLEETLDRLAKDNRHEVSVWLFGHRIAWEAGESPGLIEQDDYLNEYFGRDVANGLEPGKDVEMVLPMAAFDETQLREIQNRLRLVKAWGDSPLYLAMTGALATTRPTSQGADGRLIVITAGENVQWMVQGKHTKLDVLKAALNGQVCVDVIALERTDGKEIADESELIEITDRTGGRYLTAASKDQLAERLDEVLTGSEEEEPEPDTENLTPGDIAKLVQVFTTNRKASPTVEKKRITGVVTFYGKPVRKATVQVEGGFVPPVRTDELGGFTLEAVEPGTYTLEVEGIAKNKYRRARYPVVVPARSKRSTFARIELE